jgi:nicotinamide-nucleotide amidase
MRIVLINTGTELLLGDVRDAHLSFIAQQILPLGLRIAEQRTVPDGPAIRDAFIDVVSRAGLIFLTGGLGPTTDDLTREIVAEALGLELEHNSAVMAAITDRLNRRGVKFTERISRQAMVPRGARVLPNDNGTAPGFYVQADTQTKRPHVFVLPGPPRELQPMFRDRLLPILRTIAPPPAFIRKSYRIASLGESLVEQRVGEKIQTIGGVELGYCARPGEVDIRVMGEPAAIAKADEIIRRDLGRFIFSTDNETLEEVVVRLLREQQRTLALAESCTGGWLANCLTNVPGASEVFIAGYVTYANLAKVDALGVDRRLIEEHGAVSDPVARAMAEGARSRSGSTCAISTTGVAGPGGGSDEKPVGTVYLALATPEQTMVRKLFYPADRPTFKDMVAQTAFDWLRRDLIR